MDGLPRPVNVAPLIKGARWALLIGGILYGMQKRAILRTYEKTESVRRRKKALEKEEREKLETQRKIEGDLASLAREFHSSDRKHT